MGRNKTILRLDDFVQRVDGIISNVIHFKKPHHWLLSEMKGKVWEHSDYKRLSQYERGYLRGVFDLRSKEIHKHLYFAYVVDGERTTFDVWREKNPDAPGEEVSAKFTSEAGGYYWNEGERKYS